MKKDSNIKETPQVLEHSISSSYFLEVIDKLPHSKGRVPFTYHHDWLRSHSKHHNNMSRSEVASSHLENDIELYAVCLVQILDELAVSAFRHIGNNDVSICKKAIEISENVLMRYNN